MPMTAAGLTLNLLGALFLYLSTPSDPGGGRGGSGPGKGRGGDVSDELWLPDQAPEDVMGWLRSWNKRKFGFLLLAVGFALQLYGFYVPGGRVVA